MKVLFFTPYLPGPPVFGGQRRIHGLMTALAKSHEVSLLSLVDASADLADGLRDAARYCREVITVPDRLHRVSGRLKRVLQLQSVFSAESWEQRLHRRPALQRALDQHLAQHHYDVINVEFSYMGGYRFPVAHGGARATRLVVDGHNIEYDILKRTAQDATRLDRKLYNAVNYRKLKREEHAVWQRFDGCTFTSERDEEIARRAVPSARTAVIPNGVDVHTFAPRPIEPAPRTVLFFGAINYFPNTDAVLFFLREVAPMLVRRYPDVRIRIVGPGAPPEVTALASEHVEMVGFVDDLPAEIARATLVVAPLRIGGGTRLKIVEAMAMAKPIVATTLGAEGLDVEHGHDILLADEPESLAREIGRVLDDPALGRRLGDAARRRAEGCYSWDAVAQKLGTFYEELRA